MIRPPRLRPGDKVALVAPASPFQREQFENGVHEIRRLGFDPVYDERVFSRQGYVAGAAIDRAKALLDAWSDPTVRAIFAVRGGYGSAQLLPWLDSLPVATSPKVFVGYSDVTALLCLLLQRGLVCFHGPMLDRRLAKGEDGYDKRSLIAAICEPAPLGVLAPEALQVISPGEATGVLVGGTLTQLASLLGTPWAFTPPRGSILFLEDVGERPYRIDRMLTQLRQARVLDGISALVFGVFPDCMEQGDEYPIQDVVRAVTADLEIPILFGFPSGHTPGPAWTLPLGVQARVVAGPRPALIVEEAAVQ